MIIGLLDDWKSLINKKNDGLNPKTKLVLQTICGGLFVQMAWANKLIDSPNNYGSSNKDKKKYLVEFVSANPTGPLHVGHCRGAILGDVISNILEFNQNIVEREYYVNDYGNQISLFNHSVY